MEILQKRLTELRSEKGLSQKELAKNIGASDSAICFWENGVNEPKATYIYQMATFFEVSADYLLGLEDETGARPSAPMAASSPRFSSDELELIKKYRNIDERFKKIIRDELEVYSSAEKLISKSEKKV